MIINFLKAMLISFLVLAIGILLISSFSDINHECSVDKSSILSFDNIYENLTNCIHGQNQSLVHVAKVVENFQLNSKDQFLWIVGPIGVGKSKTVNILKNILSNMKVILLYASLLPTLPDVLTSETQELVHKFDLCVPNVIVIDEFDSENNFINIQNYIKKLLFELNVSNKKPKLMFIVIGSFKQELVFDSYINHINSQNSRNSFHMQNIIDNLSLTEVMITFYKTFHIDYSVVPFLPLEKEQLKHCIVLEINRLVNKEHCSINETKFIKALQKYNISFDILFKDIFTMSNLRVNKHFRKTGTNIVSSGCKRVYSLLQVFLFNQT